jgi:hypothetical protein
MLERLKLAKYRFVLEAIEPMGLPPYKGAVLRGGFGHAFKRMACLQPGGICDVCQERTRCAYSYVFETPVPPDSEVLRTHEAVPRPFVFEPPLDGKTVYEPDDELAFGLVLIGRGIDYLPYFILAFKALGEEGLGQGRGRFRLKQVWAGDPLGPWETLIYDGPSDALRNVAMAAGMADIERAAGVLSERDIIIHFLTPTEIKHDDRIVHEPAFHMLIRALLRRISSLSYFHCGERWEIDYQGLIAKAQMVDIVESALTWQNWGRFSGRQERRIEMGGVIGRLRFAGSLADFRPLLLMGSVVHVGKACVFGNGQYVMADTCANRPAFSTV